MYAGQSFVIEHQGLEFTVSIEYDDHHGAPWDRECGHVDVTRVASNYGTGHGPSKAPGEYVFHRGAWREYAYVVNIPDAIAKALREGWGGCGGRTKREQAANAVARDIAHLRGWCANTWEYIGVTVSHGGESSSLWGIESNADEYIRGDVVPGLASDIMLEIARNENTEVYHAN